jgi:peptidoglycan/xylan/chitin deacetylase (PgdA/CDA1 family)
LDLLSRKRVAATFFCISEKAFERPEILARIQSEGHAIGNHSLDHRYGVFFRSDKNLKQWILQAERSLSEQWGAPSVGFRPPAGVVTPPLRRVLRELDMPLVLWDVRFYDRIWRWKPKKALAAVRGLQSGEVILLHDAQRRKNLAPFLDTLELFIDQAQAHGFIFKPLTRSLFTDKNKIAK